jgi:hypothetical protein
MITLDQAKAHLRVDHDSEDAYIEMQLWAAQDIVREYLNGVVASQANFRVIDAAVLLVLGDLYANRESQADPLSPSVRRFLAFLRKPVFA